MKMLSFSSRNLKEILRDPLNLCFGIAFPVVLLLLLTMIEKGVSDTAGGSVPNFRLEMLTPGVAVFGLSFMALFAGMLISKDRSTSYLTRLFASPLTASDFILGYMLPLIPMAVAQSVVAFGVAYALGLNVPIWNVLLVIVTLLPSALLYISLGLLAGTVFNDKQVGGICGALLTNLSAWLSDTWFSIALVGGVFEMIAKALPFYHAVLASRAALDGAYAEILPNLAWVMAYTVVILVVAIILFRRKMKSGNV